MTILRTTFALAVTVTICSLVSLLAPNSYAQAQSTPTGTDPAAVQTETQTETEDGPSPSSFVDRMLRDTGNKVGFALGVFHVYSGNTSDQITPSLSGRPRVVRFTSAQPRLFTRFAGRHSSLRLDYGFGYRVYHNGIDLNGPEHSASAEFDYTGQRSTFNLGYAYGASSFNNRPSLDSSGHSASIRLGYKPSPRVLLQLSDTARRYSFAESFRSTFDSGQFLTSLVSSLSSGSSLQAAVQDYFFDLSQDVYLGNQRVTANTAAASVSYEWNRKSTLHLTASHELQRYSDQTFVDLHALQAGIRGDYRINEWLYFDTAYTAYLNDVDERYQNTNIQRLQIGGLRHKMRNGLELSMSGGLEYARHLGRGEAGASVYAGAAKSTGVTNFALSYHHGFAAANGTGTVLTGNDGSAYFSTWITRRIGVGASATYMEGSSGQNNVSIETLSGSGSIQFALQRHLLFTVQYSNVYQRTRNVLSSASDVDRYAVSAGIQYYLPSLYGR